MKISRNTLLIHGFALLHLATAVACRMIGVDDALFLTLLTMTLTLIICLREKLSLEFTAVSIVMVNIVGFGAGYGFAALLQLVIGNTLAVHGISTFLTTEMIGWALHFATRAPFAKSLRSGIRYDSQFRWLIAGVVAIYVVRVIIDLLTSDALKGDGASYNSIIGSSIALAIFLIDIIFISYSVRRNIKAERDEADRARFQYMSLKQQVNPHFLFNSLNVLDALVGEGRNSEASTYIHKLAGIYRYMLHNEKESAVPLSDELTFTKMYTDLLMLRFPEGLKVNVGIPEEDLSRYVAPCSLQLLVENATKHNAISASHPLVVDISSDGQMLCVSNNRIPKVSPVQSTGLGLNYIRQQYRALSGKEAEVQASAGTFTVKLPLL